MNYEEGRKYIFNFLNIVKKHYLPEQVLWSMVIAQAIYDLRDEGGIYREDAIKFLTNETGELLEILELCDFYYPELLKTLKEIAESERK